MMHQVLIMIMNASDEENDGDDDNDGNHEYDGDDGCKRLLLMMVMMMMPQVVMMMMQQPWEIDYRNLSEVCPIISDNFIGSDKFIG